MLYFNQYFQGNTRLEISELKPDNFIKPRDYKPPIRQMKWKSFTHFHKTILFFDNVDKMVNSTTFSHAIYTGIRNSTKIKRYQSGNPPILQDVDISSINYNALIRLKIYIEIQRIRTKNPRFAEIIYKSIVGRLSQFLQQPPQLRQQKLQQQQPPLKTHQPFSHLFNTIFGSSERLII